MRVPIFLIKDQSLVLSTYVGHLINAAEDPMPPYGPCRHLDTLAYTHMDTHLPTNKKQNKPVVVAHAGRIC